MADEKKIFGFTVDGNLLVNDMFDTVEELIEFAQAEYDDQNEEYFDEDQHRITVMHVKKVKAFDFAPSLDVIVDHMTDQFYAQYPMDDDDADVDYYPKEEAKKDWEAFIEKYFEIPHTHIGYADVGEYDLKERRWINQKNK